jgi:predicted Zn-dependent protease
MKWGLRGVLLAGALMLGGGAAASFSPGASDPLLELISGELNRSWEALRARPEQPHYLALQVIHRRNAEVQATHGAASHGEVSEQRHADVDLRVGSPDLDNTHKLRDAGWASDEPRELISLPLTLDEPRPSRLALWKGIDEAYRNAARRLIKVRTNDAVKVEREDQSADFSSAPVVVDLRALEEIQFPLQEWKARVRESSAVLTRYPDVYDSNVSAYAQEEHTWLVNSEGSRIRHSRWRLRVAVWASTVADDGMELSVYDYVDAADPSHLPSAAQLSAMAERVGQQVTDLRSAPLVDPYIGPAILRGRAAAVFFHEILGHRVEGHRQKDEDEGQTLTDKVGKAIFPDFIDVVDDPTLATWGSEDLSGHYLYDDEGVRAERASIIDGGVLKGFLMSRAPIEGFGRSNGHGRRQPGSSVVARQGNLIVSARKTMPYEKLRQKLIADVKASGRPFGLIFDDISGGFTFTGRSTPNSYAVQPVTVWRVWPDGRPDELVRGVDLIGTPLATFSRITAASDRAQVFNGVCGAESGWVPVSAIAPDLLVSEVEVQRSEKQNDRPPLLLPPPGAAK